ncbi:MAG: DUF1320 domain-containing protein [Ignavibacteria bacterium]|nr:DUF1320 domain-containing protein [Ignavibacteria bacterium]MCU7503796.1 DUF1320 domain-containing protein [Ignavibacteria bacterium]MCU7517190.1 DUF1320 domain-containing protein [Ignavibacteria bacterium]
MYSSFDEIKQDIDQDLLIQLTNDENRTMEEISLSDPEDPIIKRVNNAVKDADDEIDSYLRSRYTLPLTSVPNRVKKFSRSIAVYNLYKRRHILEMPESLVTDYKLTVKDLLSIQKGFIQLEIDKISDTPGQGVEIRVNKTQEDRIFSKDVLSRF